MSEIERLAEALELMKSKDEKNRIQGPLFFCPLTSEECKRERCMWYMRPRRKCAILVIAEKL